MLHTVTDGDVWFICEAVKPDATVAPETGLNQLMDGLVQFCCDINDCVTAVRAPQKLLCKNIPTCGRFIYDSSLVYWYL